MRREQRGTSEPGMDRAVAWYARPELPGPWRMRACREHGRVLEGHRFARTGAGGRDVGGECALCGHPELLREVETCTCEHDTARCPAHQNIGCGG